MAKTHVCYGEGRAFPVEQFEVTKDGSFIHMVSDPHFADTAIHVIPGRFLALRTPRRLMAIHTADRRGNVASRPPTRPGRGGTDGR